MDPDQEWQKTVASLLAEGYGVEDIALKTGTAVEYVRAEVRILRESRGIKKIFKRSPFKRT